MSAPRAIASVFERCRVERRAALIAYIAAGDPTPSATVELARGVVRGGADIVEIGVPFSDPLADGPIIQAAYTRALAGGTTVRSVLEAVEVITAETEAPVVLMTSWNPVLAYGPGHFCADAGAIGVAGMLIPDLLPEDASTVRIDAQRAGLDTVFLAAPGISEERLQAAARVTSGFLYLISRRGVTGPAGGIGDTLEQDVARARQHCNQPIAVGFGITTPDDAARVAQYADGVIVGSALVKNASAAYQQSVTAGASDEKALAAAASAVSQRTADLLAGMVSVGSLEGLERE